MELPVLEQQNKDIQNYIQIFLKKIKSFRTRTPIFFNFQMDLFKVYIQEENTLSRVSFDIDYEVPVQAFIHSIHMYLREHMYPKIVEKRILKIDPPIEVIHDRMTTYDEDFDTSFKVLSSQVEKRVYIIDKVDKLKNRLILVESGNESFLKLFKVDMPVVVFINRLLPLTEEERFEEFKSHTEFIEKKD
jgi:hypothetical protein